MKQKKNLIQSGAALLLITLVISCIMIRTNYNIRQMLSDSVHQTLDEVAKQQSYSFSHGIDADICALQNIALMLNANQQDQQPSLIEELVSHTGFSTLVFVDMEGKGINEAGKQFDFSGNETYRRAMLGETVIGANAEPLAGSNPVIPIALPVYDGEPVPQGVLIGGYPIDKLYTLIPPFFKGSGKAYLVNREGELLVPVNVHGVSTDENRFFDDFMNRMKTLSGSDKPQILQDMSSDLPGHIIFELDGLRWHCHYNPTGIGNWYIFTIVRYDIGTAYASSVAVRLMLAGTVIIICFLLCLIYIFREQRKHTAALERAAYLDELCGCPNLVKFKLNAQEFIEKYPDVKTAIVKFDIGAFKLFNKIFGKEAGDQILTSIAYTLQEITPAGCYCRAHDDEYYALLICDMPEELSLIHKKIQNLFYDYVGEDSTYQFSVVMGCYYMFFEDCQSASEGIERANIAHSQAKELGKEICVYDDDFVQQALWKKQVENRLESALANHEFIVYLQAQYSLPEETVSSAEALVRWKNEKDGLLMPGDFIPILEEAGLITKLDFYVWEKVCQTLREWIDEGITPIEIAVNFSRKHLANPNLVEELCEIADKYKIPHRLLAVELTESIVWENEKVLFEVTQQLHENGFLLSLDDFGTGYSSLSLLKNLPVDVLKIDRSFFTDNRYKTRAKQLITSVMKMAEQLNMTTIAEGVEEKEHIDFLREVGCNKIQGYYYEQPIPSDKFWSRKKAAHLTSHPLDTPIVLQVGDVQVGRGDLGDSMPVAVYRLFQTSMREALEQRYGNGEMVESLRTCGWIAGRSFAYKYLDLTASIQPFFEELCQIFLSLKIGQLEVENFTESGTQMILVVRNDLDCSGMENSNTTFCQYDEGFIAGILYEYTHKVYSVIETDCWGTGADVCRFSVKMR